MSTKFVVGYAIAAVIVAAKLLGCAGALTATDKSEDAAYGTQQTACIAAHPGDKAKQDACIADVKKDWCAKWAARFDAGVCQ